VVGVARPLQEVQPGSEADVRMLAGQQPEAVEELRGEAMIDFGVIVMPPAFLLTLLERVEAGESAIDVFAEATIGSDRVDKDGVDEL
jgi:hypothetical protein